MTRVGRFGTLYSLTLTWLAGCGLAVAVAQGRIEIGSGVSVLAIVGLLLLQVSCRRELAAVHELVNGRQEKLIVRVEQLVGALKEANGRIDQLVPLLDEANVRIEQLVGALKEAHVPVPAPKS